MKYIYIYVLIGLLGVPLIYYGFAYFNYKKVLFNFILSIILCLIFIGCIIGYKKGGNKEILGKVLIGISIVGGILLGDSLYKLVNKNNNSSRSLDSDYSSRSSRSSLDSDYSSRSSRSSLSSHDCSIDSLISFDIFDKPIDDGIKSPYDNE